MTRSALILALLLLSTFLPWWLTSLFLLLHALFFGGLELIFLAALIDAYYLNVTSNWLPYYTLLCTTVLILVEIAKPYLLFYNQN